MLSTVTLTALQNGAEGGQHGLVRFSRDGNAGSLIANFAIAGQSTATQDLDYSFMPTTGAITFMDGQSNYDMDLTIFDDLLLESPETVTLDLVAGDYTIGSPASATVTITDNDTSPPNHAPDFGMIELFQFAVSEASSNGTMVGMVCGIDIDMDPLSYSITAGNGDGAFAINEATGQITVADNTKLDFDEAPQRALTVQVSDGALTDTATVAISILDVNRPPVAQNADFQIAENTDPFTLVGTVQANDPDAGQILTFAITAGNEAGVFGINGAGQLHIANNTTLDYESTSFYVLTVRVTDNGVPAESATATIVITIVDVNEAPEFDSPNNPDTYAFTVGYGLTSGNWVGRARAIDPDNDPLAYAIIAGNPDDIFTIHNDGWIELKKDLPQSNVLQYLLTIRATDPGGLFDIATVTVSLKTMVVVTGDTHASELSEDPIRLVFVRLASDKSSPLDVTYSVTWSVATPADLVDPSLLVDAGQTTRTVQIAANADRFVVPDLRAIMEDAWEGKETFRVEVIPTPVLVVAPSDYIVPIASGKIDLKNGTYGQASVDCTIVDGITLFGNMSAANPNVQVDLFNVDVNDIMQGGVNDCFLMAAIGEIAQQNPAYVESSVFTLDATGTMVGVRFYPVNFNTSPPTIAAQPVTQWVSFSLDNGYTQAHLTGDADVAGNLEVWPIIWEKAYRAWKGWGNNWGQINGGWYAAYAWMEIFGQQATVYYSADHTAAQLRNFIEQAFQNDGLVCVGTDSITGNWPGTSIPIIGGHAYMVTGLQGNDGVWLRNPWGNEPDILLSWNVLTNVIARVYIYDH